MCSKLLERLPSAHNNSDMATLELIAHAVAGRPVALQLTDDRTYTDGATIFLGNAGRTVAGPEARTVICQAALIAAGSLDHETMRRLSRCPSSTAERYLGLEVARASRQLEALLPAEFRAGVAAFVDTVGVTLTAEMSLALAKGRTPQPRAPDWFGQVVPRAVLRESRGAGRPASDHDIAEALRQAMEEAEEPGAGNDDRGKLVELLSSSMRNPLGSAFRKMLGGGQAVGGAAAEGAEVASVGRRSGHGAGRAVPREAAPIVEMGGQLVRGHRYAEWDHTRLRYRDEWCTVGEFDPPPSTTSTSIIASSDSSLERALARLGLTYRPHPGERMGDDLDLAALVEHRVRLASGVADEPLVYRAERRTQQQLGALVLLDATGSTADLAGSSSVFEEQRRLVLDLTTALDRLGVRVATHAFYSRGRGDVRFLRCKSFDEPWSQRAQRRLLSVTPGGFTRLGAALRHGTHLLDAQAGTQRRLLLVVGDGIPYDDGYEGRYALEDSRRAVDEAGMLAVACVGLSAVPSPEGESIWPAHAHRVVPDTATLAREARDVFGGALHRATRRSSTTRHA